jgi:hypothetical protein
MRYMVPKLAAISVSCCALVLASGLTAAQATRKVTITSHVTIQGKGLKFSGKVTASNAACQSSRRVTLYRKLSNGSGQSLASTVTGSSGTWKITASGSAGITMSHFYATVKRRSEGTAGTIYICTAATSNTIPYKP